MPAYVAYVVYSAANGSVAQQTVHVHLSGQKISKEFLNRSYARAADVDGEITDAKNYKIYTQLSQVQCI